MPGSMKGRACWCFAVFFPIVFGGVPMYLLDGVLSEVKMDVQNWKHLLEEVQMNVKTRETEAQQLVQMVSEQTESLQLFTKESEEAGKELRHLHDLECGLEGLKVRHASALRDARERVE
eukprot:CAMPEP_0118941022 /NCGR_PEP_ID=MMETSP1169-20130426/32884_1 /TAXON_ID=36882 /ORGANISM="Pyramimonas obovata, Strain CCMP722" /LENGTH=118 /DNA_ID=CAMNT_0006885671 /DNA_START=90 /DNA_END=443 /DNA_ORIENTATION=+